MLSIILFLKVQLQELSAYTWLPIENGILFKSRNCLISALDISDSLLERPKARLSQAPSYDLSPINHIFTTEDSLTILVAKNTFW